MVPLTVFGIDTMQYAHFRKNENFDGIKNGILITMQRKNNTFRHKTKNKKKSLCVVDF